MARFIQVLSMELLRRIRKGKIYITLFYYPILEANPSCKTPKSLCITADIKKRFVDCIKQVAFLSIFSKDQIAVMSIHSTLKYLAWIDPYSLFPPLLELVYPALESVTEVEFF